MLVKEVFVVKMIEVGAAMLSFVQKDGDGGGDTMLRVSQHCIIAIMLDDGDDGADMVDVWQVMC